MVFLKQRNHVPAGTSPQLQRKASLSACPPEGHCSLSAKQVQLKYSLELCHTPAYVHERGHAGFQLKPARSTYLSLLHLCNRELSSSAFLKHCNMHCKHTFSCVNPCEAHPKESGCRAHAHMAGPLTSPNNKQVHCSNRERANKINLF